MLLLLPDRVRECQWDTVTPARSQHLDAAPGREQAVPQARIPFQTGPTRLQEAAAKNSSQPAAGDWGIFLEKEKKQDKNLQT